jgi:hypothetical protein
MIMVAEGGRRRAGLSTATVAGPAFARRWSRVALGQALPRGGCRGKFTPPGRLLVMAALPFLLGDNAVIVFSFENLARQHLFEMTPLLLYLYCINLNIRII